MVDNFCKIEFTFLCPKVNTTKEKVRKIIGSGCSGCVCPWTWRKANLCKEFYEMILEVVILCRLTHTWLHSKMWIKKDITLQCLWDKRFHKKNYQEKQNDIAISLHIKDADSIKQVFLQYLNLETW